MKELENGLVKAVEVYSNQILIRTAINAVPFIGGPLDVLLSSYGQRFVARRIEKFIEELSRQVSALEETKVNKEFLTTEAGFDLIVGAFNSASRTRQDEKLALYALVVKRALDHDNKFDDEAPEMFLRIIEELSLREFKAAMILYRLNKEIDQNDQSTTKRGDNDAEWISMRYPEFQKDELVSTFVRLERTGLVRELVGMYFDYQGGHYLINPMFDKFVEFLGTRDLSQNSGSES